MQPPADYWICLPLCTTCSGASIPSGATLLFDVELMEIKEAPQQENIFKVIDKDEDKHLTSDEVCSIYVCGDVIAVYHGIIHVLFLWNNILRRCGGCL